MTHATRPLRALLWKEWREVWAVGVATVLAIVLAAGWYLGPNRYDSSGRLGFSEVMQQGLLLVAPLSGIGLGLLQILRERTPDAWGFCMQRTITRSSWFWAKVLVATCALVAAWSLGTALVAAWCIWPGIPFIPFLPELLVLSVATQVLGLAGYAAGVATAAGNGRWWTTRWFPLVPVWFLSRSFGSEPLYEFIIIGFAFTIMLLLVGLAYWMAGPGGIVRRGWWLTTIPTWILCAALGVWTVMMVDLLLPEAHAEGSGHWSVDERGHPFMSYSQHFEAQLVDEQGRPLPGPIRTPPECYVSTNPMPTMPVNLWTQENLGYLMLEGNTDSSKDYPSSQVVVYLPTRGEIIAYDRASMQRTAFHSASGPRPILFGRGELWEGVDGDTLVIAPTEVSSLNEKSLTFRTIFQTTPPEVVLGGCCRLFPYIMPAGTTPGAEPDMQVVITNQRIVVLRPGYAAVSLPSPADIGWVTIYPLSDGRVMTMGNGESTVLTTYDAAGHLVSEHSLVRPPNLPPVLPTPATTPIGGLVPLAITIPAFAAQGWWTGYGKPPINWPDFFAISAAIHLLCVGVVLWRARRYYLTRGSILRWTVFTAIAGWPGLLVFMLHADLPPRVPCPVCTKKRILFGDNCASCGAPWPELPRIDGTGMAW